MGIPPYRGHSKMESDGQPVEHSGHEDWGTGGAEDSFHTSHFWCLELSCWKNMETAEENAGEHSSNGMAHGVLEARCMRNVLVRVYSAGLQIHVFCGGLDSWNLMKSSMDTWRFAVEISSLQHRVPPNYKLT